MENRPEYVGIWYGLSKLGVITALINTNLRSKVLIYSIEVANPKIVIYDEELEHAMEMTKNDFKEKLSFIRQGLTKPTPATLNSIPSLDKMLSTTSNIFEEKVKINRKGKKDMKKMVNF